MVIGGADWDVATDDIPVAATEAKLGLWASLEGPQTLAWATLLNKLLNGVYSGVELGIDDFGEPGTLDELEVLGVGKFDVGGIVVVVVVTELLLVLLLLLLLLIPLTQPELLTLFPPLVLLLLLLPVLVPKGCLDVTFLLDAVGPITLDAELNGWVNGLTGAAKGAPVDGFDSGPVMNFVELRLLTDWVLGFTTVLGFDDETAVV